MSSSPLWRATENDSDSSAARLSGLLIFRVWYPGFRSLRSLHPGLNSAARSTGWLRFHLVRCPRRPALYFLLACQAASTSTSRSGLIPARNFACLSAGCALNQSRVACVVSGTDRNVSPLLNDLAMLILENPAESPFGGTQTGMSPHGETFCAARNSASAQVNRTSALVTCCMPASIRPIVRVDFGPVALKIPVVPCSTIRIVH